jgi:hypothetical protein
MQLEDGRWSQAGDRLQFKQATREHPAHTLERFISLATVQLLDASGDRGADAGNALERSFAYQLPKRPHETAQAGGGAYLAASDGVHELEHLHALVVYAQFIGFAAGGNADREAALLEPRQ